MKADDRGSVLLLMPAAVLVFLVLGALSVDFAGAFASERQLANAAAAAANDAAAAAVDLSHLYETGEVRLVPQRAQEIAARSITRSGLGRLSVRLAAVEVSGRRVTVTVTGRAPFVLAKAVPGGPDGMDVSASSTATAEE